MQRPHPVIACALVLLAACNATTSSSRTPSGSSSGSGRPHAVHAAIHLAPFHLPSPLQREVVIATPAGLVLAGGLTSADVSLSAVSRLDTSTGALTSLGSLAVPVHDAAGVMLGGRILVFGGGGSASLDIVQTFDPSTGHSSVIGHLPGPRSDLAAGVVGGTAYVLGGYDDSAPRREIYATTDGVTFRKVGELPIGLRYPGVVVVGSKLVIVGGQTATGASAAVLVFDPATRRVTKLATLPSPVGHAAVFEMGGLVYVVGGLTAGGLAVRTVTTIDPATGAVTALPPLHHPGSDAGVGVTSTGVLIIGGATGSEVTGTVASILIASLKHGPAVSPTAGPTP